MRRPRSDFRLPVSDFWLPTFAATRFTGAVHPFEFIAVFYSVVLGVAVAQLMTGVARLVEERRRVRNYWVHSLWALAVLLADVGNWWGMWDLRNAQSWQLLTFLLLVALTGVIFLMTVLLFPRMPETGEQIDLRAHYYANSAIFLRGNAAAWSLALFVNWTLFPTTSWLEIGISIPAAVVILSLIVAQTKRPLIHAIFSVLVLSAMIVMLLLEGARIQ